MTVNPQITDAITQTNTKDPSESLDQHIIDAIASGNLQAIADRLAVLLGQINAHLAQHHQQGFGARSAVDVLTNNELAQTIADLKAVIQSFPTK